MQFVIYLLAVLLILVLDFVIVLSFLKYRFKNDQTLVILILFGIAFFVCIFFTITLLTTGTVTNVPTPALN